MHDARVLLVEDDRTISDALFEALGDEGANVFRAFDGHTAERFLADPEGWDCVLLDLMLPGPSGLELLRGLRVRDSETPVLILTARGEESDKVLGLELGADDYVTKPFSLRELLARVRAAVRRSPHRRVSRTDEWPEPFALGGVRIDLAARTVTTHDTSSPVSPKEAAVLATLWRHRGKVLTRDQILDEVWGRADSTLHRTIDTHILNLRKKIEADPRKPQFLLTAHGAGYRLEGGRIDNSPTSS